MQGAWLSPLPCSRWELLHPVGAAAPGVPGGCRIMGGGQLPQSPELGSYWVPRTCSWGHWTLWMSPPSTSWAPGQEQRARGWAEEPRAWGCWCRVPLSRLLAGNWTQAEGWSQHGSLWRKDSPTSTQWAPRPCQGPQELTCTHHPSPRGSCARWVPRDLRCVGSAGAGADAGEQPSTGAGPGWAGHGSPMNATAREEPSQGAHTEQAAAPATELATSLLPRGGVSRGAERRASRGAEHGQG